MKRINIFVATGVLLAMGCATVIAACTYLQIGGNASCLTNDQCSTYTTPVATTCTDAGSATGAEPSTTATNTVTKTTYSGGSCSGGGGGSMGGCTGGTSTSTAQGTNVDTYCVGCSS